ncbi:MAG: UDP-phosphate galactose phosphotransferase [Thiothrix sp.]|nr:MAG: UDP-phosphate galactose phosphotransferase [Thiothrix sp.]
MGKTETVVQQPSRVDEQCEVGKPFSTLELPATDDREQVIEQEPHSTNARAFYKDQALRAKPSSFKRGRLFKQASIEKRFYLLVADCFTMTLSVVMGYFIAQVFKSYFLPGLPEVEAVAAFQAFPILFGFPMLLVMLRSEHYGHYSRFRPFWDEYGQFIKIVVTIAGLTTIYLFFTNTNFSRVWLGATWFFVFFFVPVGRVLAKRWMMLQGKWFSHTVIIGSGKNALESALAIESNILMGFKVVALLDLNKKSGTQEKKSITDFLSGKDYVYPVLPLDADSGQQLDDMGSPYIVLALESEDYIKHRRLLEQLVATRHNMSIIPPLRGLPLLGAEISPIFRHEVLHLRIKNNLASRGSRIVKRFFDLIVSCALLLVLSPAFLYLGWRIRKDGGPAFYSQSRIGKHGKSFSCYKFRSMRVNADKVLKELLASDEELKRQWDQDHKLKEDPRVTAVGRFLRKTSLDEFPQLLNVFKGEMSLVGPRPISDTELVRYGVQISYYLETPPGITGLWQISGRNDVDYSTRVNLDAWYARNWSLWYDITILFKTVRVVFRGSGAY